MKIYFMTSPRTLEKYTDNCVKIYDVIESIGHQNTSKFVNEVDVEKFYDSDIKEFHKSTINDLKKADICVFETSVHSLAIGQLLNEALQLGKPVIALYADKKVPFFLSGTNDDKVQVIHYTKDNLEDTLKDAIDYASSQQDVRFNFFISPTIGNYLDWISKVKKIPRSVYLRSLIENDMQDNDEYNS